MKYIFCIIILISLNACRNQQESTLAVVNPIDSDESQLQDDVFKYVAYNSTIIALTNATVFDGQGTTEKKAQTLIIKDGYFLKIGDSSTIEIPKNALVLNLNGKTIIPGIVGVHNHLHIPGFPFIGTEASKLYLASGVTTIQTCGAASPYKEIELAQQITQGNIIGPKVITSGPYFDGPGGNPNMIIPRDAKHIRDTIQHWANKGVKWFKAYRNTNPEDLKIIIEEAHKHNAKVTAHLCSITFEEATILGIDGIEHGFNSMSDFREGKTYGNCNGSWSFLKTLDIESDKVKRLQQLMIDHGVFLTSTLAIYESSMPSRAFADKRSLEIMSPFLVSQYDDRRKANDSLMNTGFSKKITLKKRMQFEYQFFKMGGNLTAGVDPGRHVLPGFGDQRNFELLKESGFTTAEAIQVMTSNGAKALSMPEIGVIESGKKADFIIINGSIEDDIRSIETVFKDGYGYDPKLILKEMKGMYGIRD